MKKGLLSFLCGMFLLIGTNINSQAQDSLEVTFSVNLSVMQDVGFFNPDIHTPKIAGSFTSWQDGAVELADQLDSTYSETVLMENIFIGDTLQYKFVLVDTSGAVYWEKNFPTNSANREYIVNGSESDNDENGIPNLYLFHNWDDIALDVLDVPTPESASPSPTQDQANVISLFSEVYEDVSVDTWRTDWSSALFVDDEVNGDAIKKYVNLDFVGIETVSNQLDVNEMTHFSFDIWTPNTTTFRVKLVDFGADGVFGNDDVEHEIVWENPAQGEWIEYNIPLADFAGLIQKSNIAQVIFSGIPIGEVTAFIDNVYFYSDQNIVDVPQPPHQIGDTLNYNGSFRKFNVGEISDASEGWFFDVFNGLGTYEISGDSQDGDAKSLQVNVLYDGSPDIWRVQAVNEPIFVEEGDLVEATFWMKSTKEGTKTEAFLGLPEAGGFADKTVKEILLSTEWTEYSFQHYSDGQDADLSLRLGFKFNYFENDSASILVDNVQLVKQEVVLTEVNFSVNTEVQQSLGNFDPNVHSVGLTGEFSGWDTGSPVLLNPLSEFVYEGSIELVNVSISDTLEYKFILKDENTGVFEWESPDKATGNTKSEFNNRVLEISDLTSITQPEVYFSDIEPEDQTPSNYGITSIMDARSLEIGTHVAIQGIVTRTTNNFVYVQDETAATMMFSRPLFSDRNSVGFNSEVANGSIKQGDEIQIAGIVTDFNGQHEFYNIHGWEVLSSDNPLPAAQLITIDEMNTNGEAYESELVRMEFIQLDEEVDTLRGGNVYELTNEEATEFGWFSIQGSANSEWADQLPPEGLFNFEGILKEFFIPSLEGNVYAISAHDITDIELGATYSDVILTLDSFPGLIDEIFSVPVSITELGSDPVEAFEFTINYDPSIITVEIGDQTGFLAEDFQIVSNQVEPGKLVISAAATVGIVDLGELLNLTVTLVGGGISPFELTNIDINEEPLKPVLSAVNVLLRRCGDVTGDKTVSALDATAVLRHTVFLSPEYPLTGLDSTAADVTGNGDISAFDASKILQYEVGILEGLGCISLPIKKNPEVVQATWALQDKRGAIQEVKLDVASSDFEVFAMQLDLELSEGISFKSIKNLPKGWNTIQNVFEDRTLVSLYGVTPLENKKLDLEFTSGTKGSLSSIEADLTLNESTFTGLDKLMVNDVPQEFDLQQNYPNPFNPSTQIKYSLAENGIVNLSIYNMLGQKVAELVNTNQDAGSYQVTWNAGSLSSGVYIYRLSTSGQSFTKRMMLIK